MFWTMKTQNLSTPSAHFTNNVISFGCGRKNLVRESAGVGSFLISPPSTILHLRLCMWSSISIQSSSSIVLPYFAARCKESQFYQYIFSKNSRLNTLGSYYKTEPCKKRAIIILHGLPIKLDLWSMK